MNSVLTRDQPAQQAFAGGFIAKNRERESKTARKMSRVKERKGARPKPKIPFLGLSLLRMTFLSRLRLRNLQRRYKEIGLEGYFDRIYGAFLFWLCQIKFLNFFVKNKSVKTIFFHSLEHFSISGNLCYDLSDHLPNFLIEVNFPLYQQT